MPKLKQTIERIGTPKRPTPAYGTRRSCVILLMEQELPSDFKEFLNLLHVQGVRYLLIGGLAVIYHGYSRTTEDMDIWIALAPENAERLTTVMREFGFDLPDLSASLFLQDEQIIRLGYAPVRIEITTAISGVKFEDCYASRVVDKIDGVEVCLISLKDLKRNKKAAGRNKDLSDLDYLP